MNDYRTYRLDGVEYREDLAPDMYVLVDTYTPDHTIAPWDYYGNNHAKEISAVLRNAGIPTKLCLTKRTNTACRGSGPGGRVRMGDDMMPTTYRTYVPKHRDVDAMAALKLHEDAVHAWLHEGAPMPEACRTT